MSTQFDLEDRGAQIVNFFDKEYKDEEASEKSGRPVYAMKPYVEIKVPGNMKEVFIGPANESYQLRYPVEWNKYKALKQNEQFIDDEKGYPISSWPLMDAGAVKTLLEMGVRTLEHFVEIPDDNLTNMSHGFLTLKYRAKKFLDAMKNEAPVNKLIEEKRVLELKIEDLEKTVKELSASINELKSSNAKKISPPGR